MRNSKLISFLSLIKSNFFSGLTVGLLSIPTGISLALASNSSPESGIITAFWCGIVSGIFGGSNYNIIGPTGSLAGLLLVYSKEYGPGALPMIAILSGLFCLVAYVLRVERYLIFVPGSALHGFVLGVALIIILGQVKNMLGLTAVYDHHSPLIAAWKNLCHINEASLPTIIIFGLCFIALLAYTHLTPFAKYIPGIILLTPAAMVLGYYSSHGLLPFSLQTLEAKCGALQPSLIHLPHFIFRFSYIIPSFCVAIVSILEVMISARIADGMTKTKHNKAKELQSLAYGNITSGFFGGIPATAALARTAINIRSGCTNKISSFISGIFIGLITLFLLSYFKYLPLAAIAAILTFVSFRMIEADQFSRLFVADKKNFGLALIVAFLTIYEDPVVGILIGIVIAMLLFMERLSDGFHSFAQTNKEFVAATTPEKTASVMTYTIKGSLAYINAQAHLARIEWICKEYDHIILDLHDVHLIDLDGVDCVCDIINTLEHMGKRVYITGCSVMTKHFFLQTNQFKILASKGHVFDTVGQAQTAIQKELIDASV